MSVLEVVLPLLGAGVAWVIRQQVRQWLELRDLREYVGMPDKINPNKRGLSQSIEEIKDTTKSTSEQVTEIREALIKARIINPKE